eukprot:CAMPEP_0202437462 /NCGR_PEP_ID=MMETSP1345-20130828/29277_1 /ASSEMBLY_ACC=CAM_ASM_000843 /TAXON_ID=342563 /ORGANISM="Fabrea Fabrea salina" /LENGTH=83 /DNA_ID=CAMNT_0049051213 /DNA_START=150 /DNA_END=401 /DNA_ORIENTATION=+
MTPAMANTFITLGWSSVNIIDSFIITNLDLTLSFFKLEVFESINEYCTKPMIPTIELKPLNNCIQSQDEAAAMYPALKPTSVV